MTVRPVQPLTRLEQDDRCDRCAWPDLCASDRTCWKAESELEHRQERDDAHARMAARIEQLDG